MGKTYSKPLAARHGRGTAWARHVMCKSAFKSFLGMWIMAGTVKEQHCHRNTQCSNGNDHCYQFDIYNSFLIYRIHHLNMRLTRQSLQDIVVNMTHVNSLDAQSWCHFARSALPVTSMEHSTQSQSNINYFPRFMYPFRTQTHPIPSQPKPIPNSNPSQTQTHPKPQPKPIPSPCTHKLERTYLFISKQRIFSLWILFLSQDFL